MARVRIEWIPIQVMNLGLLGLDHLQIVYQPDGPIGQTDQIDWYVMEGTRDTSPTSPLPVLGVEGASGTTTLGEANLVADLSSPIGFRYPTSEELVAQIGTPTSRGSLVLPFIDPFSSWSLMASYAAEIEAQGLPYVGAGIPLTGVATVNSTSVIASLLYYAGLDLTDHFPYGMRFSPGYQTLIGTTAGDQMQIERQFVHLVGGRGEDTLSGTDGSQTESFYGGLDNDTIIHSGGFNIYHGGQSYTSYQEDGLDTLVLDGTGTTFLRANEDHIAHLLPQYLLRVGGQENWLFSIERFEWRGSTDHIYLGPGLEIIEDGLILDLKGEAGATNGGRGDIVNFEQMSFDLTINRAATNAVFVEESSSAGGGIGMWIENAEFIEGGEGNDRIYLAEAMRGADGGAGNDLIDARFANGSNGAAPGGVTAQLIGGAGNDTLIASGGQTTAMGGEGADRFILSTVTGTPEAIGTVEFVIEDADATDRLFAPINLFNNSGQGFEGSQLLPVLGALGTYDELVNLGYTLYFEWRMESTLLYSTDLTVGEVPFFGLISYRMDGSDLLIGFRQGGTLQLPYGDPDEGSVVFYNVVTSDPASEATVRVRNFSAGDLGLQFIDPGDPVYIGYDERGALFTYPDRDAAVSVLTNGGILEAPLDPCPSAPSSNPNLIRNSGSDALVGSAGGDVLEATGSARIDAGAGNDTVTGSSADDIIDGGAGDDQMAGGAGDDSYRVDSTGDVVTETARAGHDTVYASVDFVLPENVEELVLTGTAISGTGNEAANRLSGNALANLLDGGGGDDILFGDTGNDTLVGGTGDDTYIHADGGGDDVIFDDGDAADVDRLVLTGGTAPGDVAFHRSAEAPDDLILVTAAGDRITIAGYYESSSAGPEIIVFDDGTAWDRTDIDDAAGLLLPLDNETPIAVDDRDLFATSTALTISAAALLASDRDADGDDLAIVEVANASAGTVTLLANGDVEVVMPDGFSDTLSFDYVVSDGQAMSRTATVSLTVLLVENEPVTLTAVDDGGFTVTDTSILEIDPETLFANDSADDPAALALDGVSNAVNGTVSVDAFGRIVFDPTDGYVGSASFSYTVSDGTGATSTATVTLEVTPSTSSVGTSGADTIFGTELADTIDAGSGGDLVDGGDGNDVIFGGIGQDTLWGGLGDDLLDGGDGRDSLFGDSGNDTLFGGNGADVADGGDGADELYGDAGYDMLAGGEGDDLLDGGDGQDSLSGDGGNDTLSGGNGADVADGGDGADVIYGDAGYDTLAGGEGGDLIDGGDGRDSLSGDAGNDTLLGGNGADIADGGNGDDEIFGDAGYDTLAGGAGDDLLDGGDGHDSLLGGDGHDLLRGQFGRDTLDGGGGNDTLEGGFGSDSLDGGDGDDLLVGGSGGDVLFGGLGDDTLEAGAGMDTLDGGAGNDLLIAGTGHDTFLFAPGAGNDIVSGFKTGADLLDLTGFGLATFEDVLAIASQVGGHTVLTFDAATSLTLSDMDLTRLTVDDVIL